MAKPWEYAGDATVDENSVAANMQVIEAIINDGTDDIIFGFDGPTTGSQVRTIRPGEQYSGVGLGIECRVLYFRSVSGVQAFRAWGVK